MTVSGLLERYDMTNQLITTVDLPVDLPDLCSSTPVNVNLGDISSSLQVTFRGAGIRRNPGTAQ